MGQDQSSPSTRYNSPHLSPSTSSTTKSKSILQNILQPNDGLNNSENEIVDEEGEEYGNQVYEGIIRVVKGPETEEEDEEIKLLESLKKFDPFIKEQDKGFSLDSLLGLKQNTVANPSLGLRNVQQLSSTTEIFFELQSHIKDQMKHINNEQRILLRRIAYVDELSSYSAKSILTAFNQAKLASEKVSEVENLKEQATRAQDYAINIFKSLTVLEKYLDPQDRIQITEEGDTKWPELSHLRARALKSSHPPFERLLKSSTTNDISTTDPFTSPLLEKVVVNGEPASTTHEFAPELSTNDNPINQTGTSSTSTSSLALSRLRGISSRSIRNLYNGTEE